MKKLSPTARLLLILPCLTLPACSPAEPRRASPAIEASRPASESSRPTATNANSANTSATPPRLNYGAGRGAPAAGGAAGSPPPAKINTNSPGGPRRGMGKVNTNTPGGPRVN